MSAILLTAGSTVILELYSLIRNIPSGSALRSRSVVCIIIGIGWSTTYCEKTDKEVVVAFVVMFLVMSMSSNRTKPVVVSATLVIISS